MTKMSIRSKFLKRTIASKQHDSNSRPLPFVSSLKRNQAKTLGYLSSAAVKKSHDPEFSQETGFKELFEDHSKEIGGLQDSQFCFSDFNGELKEFNPYFNDLTGKSSKKKPCCFCKKLKSFLPEQQLFSPQSSSLNSTDTKFPDGCKTQALPLLARHCNHKNHFISGIDWFDNHAIPQYILGVSNFIPDYYPQLAISGEKFSRVTCSCIFCNKNGKKVTEKTINNDRTERKKCSRCGVPVKDYLYAEYLDKSLKENCYSSYTSSLSS